MMPAPKRKVFSRSWWHVKSKGKPDHKVLWATMTLRLFTAHLASKILCHFPLPSTFIYPSIPRDQPLSSTLDRPVFSANMPDHSHFSGCNRFDVSLPRLFSAPLSPVYPSAPISSPTSSKKHLQLTPGDSALSSSSIYIIHCFNQFGPLSFSVWSPICCFILFN